MGQSYLPWLPASLEVVHEAKPARGPVTSPQLLAAMEEVQMFGLMGALRWLIKNMCCRWKLQ